MATLEASMKTPFPPVADFSQVRASVSAPAKGNWHARLSRTAVGLCALFIAVSAEAAFQVVEDFDNLTLGDIDGQNGWSVSLTRGDVVQDPAGGDNQALKVSTESGFLRKAQSIAEGASRMLFLRLRYNEHGRYSFGFSHLSNPDEYGDFGPELGMAEESAGFPNNDFRVANSLTTEIYDVLDTLRPATWYNVWVLIDNKNKTYQVWMNSVRGRDARDSDKLTNSAGESVFGFRTSGSDLLNFFIKTGGGSSPVDGRFYLDDIYLEDSAEINLINPTPAIDMSWWPPVQYIIDQ
jgi:hypothetical protein